LERIGAEHPDVRGAHPSVGVHRSRNFSLQRSPGKGERRGIPFKNEDIPCEYPRKSLIYLPRFQRVFMFPPVPLRKSKGNSASSRKKHPSPRPDRRGGVSLSGDKSNKRRSKKLRQE
jgi:hypothetical protein